MTHIKPLRRLRSSLYGDLRALFFMGGEKWLDPSTKARAAVPARDKGIKLKKIRGNK